MLRSLLLCLLAAGLVAGCSKHEAADAKGSEVSLLEVNRALQMWSMTKGSYPSDLNQLTNFPALQGRRLPTPPPGKKLVFDRATRQAVFADQ